MKGVIQFIRNAEWLSMTVAVVVGVFFVFAVAQASTTISTDVTTGGNVYATSTLQVTGAFTAYGTSLLTGAAAASSTLQVTGAVTAYGTSLLTGAAAASSTLQVTGNVTNYGTTLLTGAAAASSTLQVTGNVINYGTTLLTGAVAASSTQQVTGNVINYGTTLLTGAAAASSTLQVTGATTHYGTMTTGTNGNAVTAIQFGTCTINAYAVTIAASTTAQVDCSAGVSAPVAITGITNGDKIFVTLSSTTVSSITNAGLVLLWATASTTNGYITLKVYNPYNTTFTWASTASTTISYLDIR